MQITDVLNCILIPLLLVLGVRMWGVSGLYRCGGRIIVKETMRSISPEKGKGGGLSGYETLLTSLAATIGTANIAGASGAVLMGGPGALFWMWVCGILGMGIKYAEAVLAVAHAKRDPSGKRCGGPMYCMRDAMGKWGKKLSGAYCAAGLIAALGTGAMWQMAAASETFSVAFTVLLPSAGASPRLLFGVIGAALAAPVVFGGGKSAVKAATTMVPFMCCLFIAAAVTVILANITRLPGALWSVFVGVLNPRAATCGALGAGAAAVFSAAASGIQTGTLSGEAGLGSAAIAYGASAEAEPARAGLCGMAEVFIDTMVICTLSVLALLCSSVDIYSASGGMEAVLMVFSDVFGPICAGIFLTVSMTMFALSSVFTWSWYGYECAHFLTPSGKFAALYRVLYTAAAAVGALWNTGNLEAVAALSNTIMAVPNSLMLFTLVPAVGGVTSRFFARGSGEERLNGRLYVAKAERTRHNM